MASKLKFALEALVIPAALFIGVSCSSGSKESKTPPRKIPVTVGRVTQKDIPLQVTSIGNVEAFSSVSVRPQVGGALTAVLFKEGQPVRKGDILFKIDSRPYEEALKKSAATLSKDTVLAAQARDDAKRYADLAAKEFVPKDQYDQILANADALEAVVKADEAQVENDRLMLEYCTIRSPIDGETGNLIVDEGNVVASNSSMLVTINKITPIYVNFSLPERNLNDVKKYRAAGDLSVEAIIPGDEGGPLEGRLTFIDNAVDTATGTIVLKATFENREKRLWPGQFVNVLLTLTVLKGVTVVPSQAVQQGQDGQFVFVVKPDDTVESRPVKVERTSDNVSAIASGLKPGEVVVTDGQLQLVPGVKVEVKGNQ